MSLQDAHELTFSPKYADQYENKLKSINSFGLRISPRLASANIKPQNIETHFTPRCLKKPDIIYSNKKKKKKKKKKKTSYFHGTVSFDPVKMLQQKKNQNVYQTSDNQKMVIN